MKIPRESLKNQYTPDEIAELDLSELAEFLKLQSKGRLGQSHAKRIQASARRTFVICLVLDAFALQL